jgi:hypothetical protein
VHGNNGMVSRGKDHPGQPMLKTQSVMRHLLALAWPSE